MDITKLDENMLVPNSVERPGLTWYDTETAPFRIYGIFREGDYLRRMPGNIAQQVSEGVTALHTNTAGGRVRFCTDSPYIAIHAEMDAMGKMDHFPFTGSLGFDLFTDTQYLGTYRTSLDVENGYEAVIDIAVPTQQMYTIHFPLYSNVKKLYIGLQNGCKLCAAPDYALEKPVVYYGSSITQGGCASRPSNAYQNILSLHLDCDHINLGFSGNAKGEDAMAEHIANLDMSAFVYDYDHNAPTVEHLRKTHNRMFQTIRNTNPDLPVLMLTRPKFFITKEEQERQEVVRATYEAALAAGDKNVYFIPGTELLLPMARNTGLVDNCHPNDMGFVSMAQVIEPVLRKILYFD